MSKPQGSSGVGPGTRLNGVFEIDELIAIGGMGRIYRGRALETGDSVAIKMIRPELAENDTYLALFRKEASALHRTPHDAIVRYYIFTTDPNLKAPYLAMEFVEGDSLSNILKRRPLDLAAAHVLRRRLAAGLEAAHRLGVIHRDVSPDNIILPGNDPNRAKLIDFGIARDSLGGATVIGEDFAGKSNFASPEQIGLYGGIVTAKSDIYSLGLTLAAALLGAPIKMSGTPADLVLMRQKVPDLSGIDPEIRPLLERMLQPDPANRPDSMAEVAAWPDPVPSTQMAGGSPPATPPPVPAMPKATRRRSRGSGWFVPAALAGVIALLGFAGWHFLSEPPAKKPASEASITAAATPSLQPASEPELPAVPAPAAKEPQAHAMAPPPSPVETRTQEPLGAAPAQTPAPAAVWDEPTPASQPSAPPVPQQDAAVTRPEPVVAPPVAVPPPPVKPTAPGAFRDCPTCPELIALRGGPFAMGSSSDPTEKPVHKVTVGSFAIGRLPVTVGEWQLCFNDKGCSANAEGDPDTPVHNLSWDDTQQYLTWLSRVSGHSYRLPTEAEWEYAARADTTTRYWWGNQFEPQMAECHGCGPSVSNDPPKAGLHPANAFGLRDVTGSVAQWVEDCWHKDFKAAPADGSAWVAPHCGQRVLRGGSWASSPADLRITAREFYDQTVRYPGHGLRVARNM
ncbi:SUMF1/EgtB/PvdO family nonheme iron enzyme [Methyloferula stellata]|uniref:SUMF1/EgtB/PvdO family nonheme iron enzyme n=1 Tax=Methyloferula stellata TaxID=876270 RepID=UPI001FCC440B|nr:SUMF1/EgtB/PvdO family nonheme iron enzyme [Methyloferula stellata]